MCGPAFVASIAYVDPGNFVTNTQAGANYGYLLMWCVFGASLSAMPVQYLSARLGVVTGKSLAAVCRSELPLCASLILWAQAEIVAMCTDLAEFVGAALGLNLLFDVPLPVAGGMTAIIAFIILRMQRDGSRKLELATAVCLALVASGFGYQLLHLKPSLQATLGGWSHTWRATAACYSPLASSAQLSCPTPFTCTPPSPASTRSAWRPMDDVGS